MSGERELVRVICQADRKGKMCRHIAARIVLVGGSPMLRSELRASLAVDAAVLQSAENAAQKLRDRGIEVTAAMFRELAFRVPLGNVRLDPEGTPGVEPIFLSGIYKSYTERFISTIENFQPIVVPCTRCYAYLNIDGGEVHAAIDAAMKSPTTPPRQIKGRFAHRPQR